ncbi:MAG: NAD(P)H-dependent oxidoreductase [Patescibacteria group bacterium]|nr:NAD(P)H-dependent oxidoreductase [Patescibacteria group bacterium]
MYIPVILGTSRKGRQSEKVAKFMLQQASKAGLESELIDTRDFSSGVTDSTKTLPQSQKLSEKISKADGLIIVSPEYNHGYPGELKMMLDMVYEEYRRKPIGICGVSAGSLGGAQMVEQLRLVGIELQMVPIRETVYFSQVQNLFDEGGGIKDESYYGRIKKFLDELIWYAKALKKAREEE